MRFLVCPFLLALLLTPLGCPAPGPDDGEVCDDGLDNDDDEAVDCEDADCVGVPPCLSAKEDCGSGIDDDGDGDVDCADADCASDPLCGEPKQEDCSNGRDDDGDGLIDCEDEDCEGAPECQECTEDALEENDTSAAATTLVPDETLQGVSGWTDLDWFEISLEPGCAADITVGFSHDDGDIDAVLYDGSDAALAFAYSSDDDESVSYRNMVWESATVRLMVEMYDEFGCNPYSVQAEVICTPLEACDDGIDDDEDGYIDCDDPDCSSVIGCIEDCDNGVDDEGDGLADCSDPECLFDPACIEDCGSGFDEDGDGLTDCADDDCIFDVRCCDDDELEDADRIEQAAPLELPAGSLSGLVSVSRDDDYFAATVAPGCELDAFISFEGAIGDVDLRLVDAVGSILTSSLSVTDDEAVSWLNEGDTEVEVFVRVEMYSAERCAPYDLLWSVSCGTELCFNGLDDDADGLMDCDDLDCFDTEGCFEICGNDLDDDFDGATDCDDTECADEVSCTCTDDALEENDDVVSAVPLESPSGDIAGLQALSGDDDWFWADVAPGCELTVDLLFTHAAGDIDLYFFDAFDFEIDRSWSETNNESLTWTNDGSEAALVYLLVTMYDPGSCNGYEIFWVMDCADEDD